jgi:hypothetical protein
MSQQTTSMQIVQMSGVAASSKTVFTNPLAQATTATIYNNDASVAITVSTDSTGSPSITIAHGASFAFECSGFFAQNGTGPWGPGAYIFNVSGAVSTQPTVVVTT